MEDPQFRLRLAEYRVFYDIEGKRVIILAIVPNDVSGTWLHEHGVKP